MSALRAVDLATLPTGGKVVNEGEYLSEVSPRHKPWDQHRGEADDVTEVYAGSPITRHHRYAERVASCAQVLEFARDPPAGGRKSKLELKNVWFCRVRHCPVCQWRRSLMWQVRVCQALPLLMRDYPETRFLFLTLTVKNCLIGQLRHTLGDMARGWKRMMEVKTFPAIGWVRSVEITRGRDGSAHPHYHCLLMVPPAYFKADYLKQRDWVDLWKQSLRIDYKPIVDVRVVRPERRLLSGRVVPASWNIWGAVVEILKYAVKPSDMVRDHHWFLTLVDEIHKTRAVAVGGILKMYIREHKREDLIMEPGENALLEKEMERLFFRWKQEVRRYRKFSPSRESTNGGRIWDLTKSDKLCH
jgi:plasmid rolling circle replication initiator protein Rep